MKFFLQLVGGMLFALAALTGLVLAFPLAMVNEWWGIPAAIVAGVPGAILFGFSLRRGG